VGFLGHGYRTADDKVIARGLAKKVRVRTPPFFLKKKVTIHHPTKTGENGQILVRNSACECAAKA
jgi:hypothetical protein